MNKYCKGFLQAIAVLLGLIVGTIGAYFLGLAHFDEIVQANWFQVVHPLYFGIPKFSLSSIIVMCLVMVVAMIESTGNFYILGWLCDKEVKVEDIVKGLRAEGVAQIIGGVFNSFPYTTYEQNIGIVTLTRVKSRYVTVIAGFILMALGMIPKFAAAATIIPRAVLGGAMIAMFGILISLGIKMLKNVDFENMNNLIIIACSISLGLGISITPNLFIGAPELVRDIFGNGIITGSLIAIVLNLFLNGIKK